MHGKPKDSPARPPEADDPRLAIPEVLRKPVVKPDFDPVYGDKNSRGKDPGIAGMGRAWAISLDFVVTILAGTGLGYLADYFLKSLPTGTIIGLVLGFITAFIRIIRASQRMDREDQQRRNRKP